jgi:serine/threonine protein kinase
MFEVSSSTQFTLSSEVAGSQAITIMLQMPLPSKLGHFNLLKEIGHGGMGTVHRAFDPTLNREVAIKVLRDELAADPKFLQDFLNEARSAASISHPHIVEIHFVGEENGVYYIVMELLKGQTLREIIEKEGPLNEERAVELAIQVTEALQAAYRNEMIHGDIKPANIMITDVGAKVLDFGLAKLANVEATEAAEIWGSPYYISPERVGQKAEDFRSDVYSLGATLFHALTGHPPFDADTPDELAVKRLNEKPPLLREISPDITAKTEQVVNKMLNKSLFLRYRDYDALLTDLTDAKTEATAKRLGVDLHPEKLRAPQPVTEPRRFPFMAIFRFLFALLLIAAAGAAVYWFWQQQQNKPLKPVPSPPRPTPGQQPPRPPRPPRPRIWNIQFSVNAPNAGKVYLAGEFNNWSETATPMEKQPNGDWVVTVPLKTGSYQYKLIVDGNRMPDPDNPKRAPDNFGGFNSVVDVGK